MTERSGFTEFPHRAYIEALADSPEGSPAWHSIIAGYAAVQLFESWADLGATGATPNAIEMRRVRMLAACD